MSFGFLKNDIGILLYGSEAEKINNATKNIIQTHVHHKWPKNRHNDCHIVSYDFSYDFPMNMVWQALFDRENRNSAES